MAKYNFIYNEKLSLNIVLFLLLNIAYTQVFHHGHMLSFSSRLMIY